MVSLYLILMIFSYIILTYWMFEAFNDRNFRNWMWGFIMIIVTISNTLLYTGERKFEREKEIKNITVEIPIDEKVIDTKDTLYIILKQ